MTETNLDEIIKRLEELEKRVTVTEDIEEIKQLTIRYLTGHTLNDGALEAEGFAEDATFIIGSMEPFVGKKAISEFVISHAENLKSQNPFVGPKPLENIPTSGHFILHPVISVNGDKAAGTWMQYCLTSEPLTMHLLYFVQALYDIEYVKREGKWQIYYMKWTPRSEPRGWGEH